MERMKKNNEKISNSDHKIILQTFTQTNTRQPQPYHNTLTYIERPRTQSFNTPHCRAMGTCMALLRMNFCSVDGGSFQSVLM